MLMLMMKLNVDGLSACCCVETPVASNSEHKHNSEDLFVWVKVALFWFGLVFQPTIDVSGTATKDSWVEFLELIMAISQRTSELSLQSQARIGVIELLCPPLIRRRWPRAGRAGLSLEI